MRSLAEALVGRTVAGCRITGVIGSGGMGTVYYAVQERLAAPVALKVIRHGGPSEDAAVKRFEREAKAVAQVRGKSPNIVQVYDYGWDEPSGTYYIAMELVDGESLGALLGRQVRLTAEQGARCARQALRALAVAHDAGLIHRDIKPDNLLLAADGTLKVADFGLVRPMDSDVDLTHSGQALGTATYMAPEQAMGDDIDHRVDLYSMGATLFACCTGAPPHRLDGGGGMLFERLMQLATEPVPDLAVNDQLIDAQLDEIVKQLMAKHPEDRFPDARTAVAALDGWLADHADARPDNEALAGLADPRPVPTPVAGPPPDPLAATKVHESRVSETVPPLQAPSGALESRVPTTAVAQRPGGALASVAVTALLAGVLGLASVAVTALLAGVLGLAWWLGGGGGGPTPPPAPGSGPAGTPSPAPGAAPAPAPMPGPQPAPTRPPATATVTPPATGTTTPPSTATAPPQPAPSPVAAPSPPPGPSAADLEAERRKQEAARREAKRRQDFEDACRAARTAGSPADQLREWRDAVLPLAQTPEEVESVEGAIAEIEKIQKALADAQDAVQRARNAVEKRDYAGARTLLEKYHALVGAIPASPGMGVQAEASRLQGDVDEFFNTLTLARNEQAARRWDEAETQWRHVLRLDPTLLEAYDALRAVAEARGSFTLTLSPDVKIAFVLIKPGTNHHGDPPGTTLARPKGARRALMLAPYRRVEITRPFWLATTETTQGQWKQVVGQPPNKEKFQRRDTDGWERLPMVSVAWTDAVAFMRKLNELVQADPAAFPLMRAVRAILPTEAQWEHACRGTGSGRWHFGSDPDQLKTHAWFEDNARSLAHWVGTRAASSNGLHDMHGNVLEWCRDVFTESPAGGRDPAGPATGPDRVVRGGCWADMADLVRAAARRHWPVGKRSMVLGFRIALEPK